MRKNMSNVLMFLLAVGLFYFPSTNTMKVSAQAAQDFATQNGSLSADGKKIRWSDGVVWVKQ